MEKQEKIIEMFNQIAPTYDKANRVLSFGVDISWRKNACEILLDKLKTSDINIVDVACGTGDMMGIWEQMAKKKNIKISSMTGVDPSTGMLEIAKEKFPNYNFITAFANKTSLPNDFADIVSISYGIRNVVELKEALNEFNRILKLGGYVAVLEFTKRQNSGFISKIRDFYLSKILPKIGALISKNEEAYRYLPSSIENFFDKTAFCALLEEAGFEVEICKGYSFEVSTLFVAKKVK
ncbi:bifunctional demethylmenaquinone methyltransferase/2-methoxy-6-polyprenyl-1,4-benzoquinol methylase UbiE [Campylobacter hyointestinalis]|uniref:bifunctional demethylmenaquinone methyltransferase/2-methoxy-6-polyprenyl-1,4-benzoquinol methylase UbiE n=1 Tax=Campylobacter hyointestinalis TaxID=198 RepID=UPI000DCDE93E|nr:bifunctional demethylmenaquinone methyltransferase/2-methoxy-6-polyprenyl-1,4-benzoquinol methylase UbiE [Campylobacter hyointestinalis]RAZ55662.1 bifunctional demethylmenaquinone methyltransferase/2-methoxy-6-polyprenyl-1,4-benzoquinol methylase UbiE [Campylobacter hyointestinalis subsp. lawsonii]RAZ64410.1 bifunctional demethylmenaquinone methyltransferase/2-methoxy-6-polyprenyl-1,4-benzoquinol methylase UbiE [Campylobacter hyointestinalis subsp. lawsonii]